MDKQIEEIANAMCLFCKEMTEENKCERGAECYEWRLKEASCYYQQGIRKIPEGAVVLTREEYERLKARIDVAESKLRTIDYARKETAREIIREIKAFIYDNDNLTERLDIIAKQYGVEVE